LWPVFIIPAFFKFEFFNWLFGLFFGFWALSIGVHLFVTSLTFIEHGQINDQELMQIQEFIRLFFYPSQN